MKLETSVLLIVDVQNGFITSDTEHVITGIVELADKWQSQGGHVLFSRYFNYAGSEFERLIDWRKLYAAPDTDLAEQLKPYGGREEEAVFDKHGYSAVTEEFLRQVHRHGWTDIVVCGIDTELCVLTTAFDAFDAGLTPWVVTDMSASTGGPQAHNAGLLVMARGIGERQLVTGSQLFDVILDRNSKF
ncbi:MAG: cysteine hydrolase family protein [Pseudonocardia sp.]